MLKTKVNLGEKSYPIYITKNFSGLGEALKKAVIGGKIVVITDSNVKNIYLEDLISLIKAAGYQVFSYVIEAGEASKNLDTLRNIFNELITLQLDRNSSIIALGGGVTGDVAGFAAASWLRGVNFIQIPTSLLAQVDSSIGGKVAVDFKKIKNIIGAFYQPKLVYINVNTLKTLSEREFRSGLAEIIKHSIIRDKEFFDYLESNIETLLSRDENALLYTIKKSCEIKATVVAADEKEEEERAMLNFGHTIGHAVESISAFNLLHGECVSIGMVGAFKLALKLGITEQSSLNRVTKLLKKIGLPVCVEAFDIGKLYQLMLSDKKARNNKLNFILPRNIGEVIQLEIDNEVIIKEVLNELIR
jgi:3-dehydroquinate synthase